MEPMATTRVVSRRAGELPQTLAVRLLSKLESVRLTLIPVRKELSNGDASSALRAPFSYLPTCNPVCYEGKNGSYGWPIDIPGFESEVNPGD